jgi:hypothetical protein
MGGEMGSTKIQVALFPEFNNPNFKIVQALIIS